MSESNAILGSTPGAPAWAAWNDAMYREHRTPYEGLAGLIERARLRQVLRWARAAHPRRVLDIGCGEGVLLDAFDDGVSVVGVDLNLASLRTCRREKPARPILQADGTEPLPFADGSFDVVLCTEVLEHVPQPRAMIAEIGRVCSPQGRVVLTVPMERLKLAIKRLLRRTPLFSLLFPGIEPGFSAWHLHDYDLATLLALLGDRFAIRSHKRIFGLHRCLLLRPLRP